MRNLVLCTVLICISILIGSTIYAIEGKTTRQNELDANLSSVIEQTMEIMTDNNPTYTIARDDEHLIADFMQNFLVRLNSNADFKIEILGVDAEKGMLSVRVTETYNTLLGKSSVNATRTIIVDDYVDSGNETYEVTFYGIYKDGTYQDPIKQVHVEADKTLKDLEPVDPMKDGYTFLGWELAGFGVLDGIYTEFDTFEVTGDLKFVAAWEADPADIKTVSFYANNQLHEMKKITDGSVVGSHKYAPTKSGYDFVGWSGPQGEIYTDSEVSNVVVNGHGKFVAVYEKK